MIKRVFVCALFLLGLFAAPARAAFISVNDNDLANITLTAGDFEAGFYVDGVLLTSGLGDSGSVTFADGGIHAITGSWIDLGQSVSPVNILFALPGSPADVTSYLRFTTSTDSVVGTLAGDFAGFAGASYFATALPTNAQNGQIVNGAAPFLSVGFDSEAAAAPEPTSLMLLGLALAGVGARGWRQRRA